MNPPSHTTHVTSAVPLVPGKELFKPAAKETNIAAEAIYRPSISFWQDAGIRLRKNKVAMTAGIYLILMALSAILVPLFLPYEYDEQEVWNTFAAPTFGGSAVVIDEMKIKETTNSLQLTPEQLAPLNTMVSAPAAPQDLNLALEPYTAAITLKWTAVPGAQGYRIIRSLEKDGVGLTMGEVARTQPFYTDRTGLKAQETYFYQIIAFNTYGDSELSATLEVTPKLSLALSQAKNIQPNIQHGDVLTTKTHLLGTDHLGRDFMTRLFVGARVSLFIGVTSALLYVFFGLIYGSLSGYIGGRIDSLMMRFTELALTIPELLIVIMLQVVMGSGPVSLVVALVVSHWPRIAMQVRGEVLRLREMEFVQAGLLLGTSHRAIIGRHIIPNLMGTVIVLFSIAIPQAIFGEAFLSFIGLGIAPPMPSWGSITREAAKVFVTYPLQLIFPTVMICSTMLAFNLFGDGLRDALDPRLRGS